MKSADNRGFTLIELLVTIGIIVLLASLVTVGVTRARSRTKIGVAKTEINNLEIALGQYYEVYGEYPVGDGSGPTSRSTPKTRVDSGNAAMVSALLGLDEGHEGDKFWKTRERKLQNSVSSSGMKVVVDSWGVPYLYRSAYDEGDNARDGIHNKDSYDLYSCGKNMVDDSGEKDDITNW